jgi:hypothetical protein
MGDPHADPIRQELRTLVDYIPSSDLPTARKFVRSLVDPVELAILNAPPDDEPESEEERAEVEVARREAGPGTPHEDLLREFGL